MIENEEIPEAKAIPIPPNPAPVALYGNQDAMDDFPVLKAFQQYVDSEQAKAHKRLMSVCFFFTMLIVVIIGVFLFVVMNMRNNRSLPDGTAEMQRHLMEQTAKMNEQLIQQLIGQLVNTGHLISLLVADLSQGFCEGFVLML
jgi:predicted PurR-regulated permease PerM